MAASIITQDRLRNILAYDPKTGIFNWLTRTGYRIKAGDVAGTILHGYVRICIDRRFYPAHRLAWFYMTGEWPINQLDHINNCRADNRLENLRCATNAENQQNRRKAQRNNISSGLLGVSWHAITRKWKADIKIADQRHYIGIFSTKEAAHAAYLERKRKVHPFNGI